MADAPTFAPQHLSCFFPRKYHVGQVGPQHWIFGGVERESGKCILVPVPDRSRATLISLIERWILPGTCIISDGWQAYNDLSEIGDGMYTHDVVIHRHNFVNPENPFVHTQTIESLWKQAKRRLRNQSGTVPGLFEIYIKEFVWRRDFVGSRCAFSCICYQITVSHPL